MARTITTKNGTKLTISKKGEESKTITTKGGTQLTITKQQKETGREPAVEPVESSGKKDLPQLATANRTETDTKSTGKLSPVSFGNGDTEKSFGGGRTSGGGGRQSSYERVKAQDDFESVLAEMQENKFEWSDLVPDVLKGNARTRSVVKNIQSNTLDTLQEQYSYMTDQDKDILLYYAGKDEWDKADRYLESIEDNLNWQANEAKTKRVEEYAEEHPGIASLLSPAASLLGGAISAGDLVAQNINRALTGEEVDYNSEGQRLGKLAEQIRQIAGDQIEENHPAEIAGVNVGRFLYDTAMSGVDSLGAALVPGGALVLGANAAQSEAKDIIGRGGSDNEAIVGGVAAGVFEGLFERFSIGNLKAMKDVPVTGIKDAAVNIMKSLGVNASEEAATETANILFDAIALGDVSNWQLSIREYMGDGMSESEAKTQTAKDMAGQVLQSAAAGGLMGAAFGGVGSAANYRENAGDNYANSRGDGFEIIEQAAYEMAEGKAVSNSQATAILNDSEAVAALMEATGKTVREDMTKSQQRAAVKEAVAELVRGRAESYTPETGTDIPGGNTAENGPLNGSQGVSFQRTETVREWENAQVDRAAKALGPVGQKMAKAGFNAETQSAVEYFGGFAAYYDAGLTEKDMAKVTAGAGLTETQKQAAYAAGVDDAARSLERQRAGLDFVAVYGKDGGLVDNDYARGLNKDKARILNWMGKATGSKVMIVDSIADAAGRQGAANGWYENGVLKIAADATDPELVVLSHEVTHRLQEIAPEEYTRYKSHVVDIMAGAGVNVESYLDRYAAAGQSLTREQAMDEMAADFTQELLLETQSFRKLMEKDRTVAQKVFDAVKEFLAKVKAVFTGNRAAQDKAAVGTYGADMETLERAVSLWGKALEEGQRTVQGKENTAARTGSGDKFYIKYDQNNIPFVVIESDILYGVPRGKWVETVKETLAQKFPNGVKVGSNTIKINAQTRKEMTYSEYTKWLGRNDKSAYADKFRAAGYADEIILASRGYINEGLNHARNDSIRDFARGGVLLRVGGADYQADVIVGTTKSGSMLLYDIVNLQRTTIKEKNRRTEQPNQKEERRSGTPATESIAQPSEKVNGKFSLKQYTEQEKNDHVKAAMDHFGRTYSWNETGYLSPDGKKLDFSGKHEGGPGGYRTVDHRDIRDALGEDYGGEDYSGGMVQFMAEGNIRISPESGGINLSVMPTKAQMEALEDFISRERGEVILDLDTTDGRTVSSTEYPRGTRASKVLADIRRYFESGETPYVSETAQFRYSLKGTGDIAREVAALRRENETLRERVEYYKGQTKRTTPGMVDRKAVDKAAKELITMYGADLQVSDINAELKALYDYMGVKGEVNYAEVRRRAEEIAGWIADNAVERDSEVYENYSELRRILKETELVVSERDKGDFADWNDFRKRNFGRLRIKNGAKTNVDGVFQELEYYYPELFNSEAISHPMDQLRHIAEVADQIYTVTEHNPFSYDRANAIQGIANEIMEKFFDVPQVAETFADQEARKREELVSRMRAENRERVERAILGEKMAGGREMARFEREFREKVKKDKTDLGKAQYRREMKAKIARHAKSLSTRLVRPTDKSNIPENLRQSVALLLDSINLESDFELSARPGGGSRRVKPYTRGGIATKRTDAARKLQAAYKQILAEDGGTITIDPDLEDTLIEVASLENILLSDMTAEQLQTVWNAMRMVEASVTRADRAFGAGRMKTITDIGESLILDNMLIGDRGEYRPWAAGIDKLLNTDMLTPQGYFHRLGATGDYLFKMMRNSQDKHIRIMESAQKHTKKILKDADVRKLEREMHTFEVDGDKLTMSTAQIMSLYELMKREQAKDHILLGGIRPDSADTGKGLKMVSRSKPVQVGIETIGEIVSVLTDEQVKLADALQKYMGNELAKLGNEASMEIYGYEKFKDKHYFPIRVDRNQTQRDVGKEAKGATIAGRGFTKALTPDAKNAVMVGSIFDVYAGHVNDMATYAAWLGTMENLRRVRNYTARGENMERVTDVQTVIERVMGKNGLGYLDKLMRDINQGVHTQGTGSPFDKLLGNYKAASVAANLRVVLQQPTAGLRALAEIDPKYLAKGVVKKGDWDKVQKYAPIAVWKDWGYFDVNTGRQMKDVLLDSDTWLEKKAKQGGMWLAGKADSFTWARLWNAVEAETKDLRADLKPGSEEFYKATADRFNDIIDRTQVVDGLLQRSQIMRSPDALQKMATSYMSEPTKTYNMFVNAVYDYQKAKGTKGAKEAKGKLARTAVALTTSFTVNALAQSIMDAFRDEDKDQNWLEKFLEAYIGFAGDEESFADYWSSFWDGNLEAAFNPLGYLPYGKDVLSIVQGYDVTRMDVEPISKIFDAGQNMIKALSGESKKSIHGAGIDLFAEVARLLGVPVANLKRDVMGFVNTAVGWSGSAEAQYHIDRFFKNMNHSGSRKGFMDILYNASQNDREAYEYIYNDMVEHGVRTESIKSAMEDRMKEEQGVSSVDDLEQRYMSPGQETAYQGYMSGVQSSPLWRKADADDRSALEQAAYEMAVQSKEGIKMQEKVDAGEKYGIHTTEYLLYKLALDMVDQPTEAGNLGTYTNDEVEEAIRMVPGLSDAARSYLWTAQGKNEKSDPWN